MRKIISLTVSLILALSVPSFASMGIRTNGTPTGAANDLNLVNASSTTTTWLNFGTLSIPELDPNLFAAGTGQGGSVSEVSSTVAVSTSAAFIRKVLPTNGDAAFTAGTLANGYPGQILTIFAAGGSPGGGSTGNNYTITPTTKTGFTSVKLTATKDTVTFLYVNDTVGWVIIAYAGTITITGAN